MSTQSSPNPVGLPIVAGSAVLAFMTLILALISETLINHRPLTVLDAQLSNWLELHRTSGLTSTMLGITSLGDTVIVISVTSGFLIYLISRKRYYWTAAVASSVFGGMLLNRFLKLAFQRPRPYFENPILTFTDYSFPSGHTMAATVFFGVVAAYLVTRTQEWRHRIPIILLAGLFIGLVAFSRMYLGAHYLSDVLAAMAEGLAWLSLCLTVLYSVQQRRRRGLEKRST